MGRKKLVPAYGESVLSGVKDEGLAGLMVVRYVTHLLAQEGVDEGYAIAECSRLTGMTRDGVRQVWDNRARVVGASMAEYEISGDLLRSKLRALYLKFVEELGRRDLSDASIKVILESLRVLSGLDMSMGLSSGAGEDVGGMVRLGNGVNVARSNVMIFVPMPDSAKRHTKDVGDGRVVSDVISEGEGNKAKRVFVEGKVAEEAVFRTEDEMDALEGLKDIERKVRAKRAGDRE